jgi:nucleoside-diphosphate-sugar epimerase
VITSILGCGWLGLPVAEKLIGAGRDVIGSTTRAARLATFKSLGIEGLLLRIDPGEESDWTPTPMTKRFFEAPTMLVTLPPEAALGDEHFPSQIETVLSRRKAGTHLVFVSSTSVYGAKQGRVDETSPLEPESDSGRILAKVEARLSEAAREKNFGLTIVRPGGLVGPGRHPGLFLAGRKNLKDPESPVNLVHQQDCADAIATLVMNEPPAPGETRIYNLVSNRHPTREDFYTRAALAIGVEAPTFASATSESATKLVIADRIREISTFAHDDLFSSLGIRS